MPMVTINLSSEVWARLEEELKKQNAQKLKDPAEFYTPQEVHSLIKKHGIEYAKKAIEERNKSVRLVKKLRDGRGFGRSAMVDGALRKHFGMTKGR
jgi:endonuclease III-like uncharacterized protein